MKNNTVIPIFYACDDAFVKYTMVSLVSLMEKASKDYKYQIYILNTNISKNMKDQLYGLKNQLFDIEFIDVSRYLDSISDKFPIRDYYSKTTYFRLYIAEIFNNLEKAIYIDSDTIVNGDISELYNYDVSAHLVGACHEQVMRQIDVYGTYAETVVGVDRNEFFNAGVLLINCIEFRNQRVLDKFSRMLGEYNFVVTQDEDYLNVICKGQVLWIPQNWNTEVFFDLPYNSDEVKIFHYIMTEKPWHYEKCRCADYFWKNAKKTSVYEMIIKVLNSYTDAQRENDKKVVENLLQLAINETNKEDCYAKRINK